MKTPFSRRSLIQGAGAAAGIAAAGKLTGSGLFTGTASAQVTPEKNALLVIYLNGGYNSVFPSADSYRAAGTFGITGDTLMKPLANGLVVDAPTFGTLPQYALDHMASVGVRHGITAHGAAQAANFGDGSRSYMLRLAAAMGGDAAKSFAKRRLGIAPGKPWFPWDQVDFVLGALILVGGRAALSWADVAIILLLSAAGHVLVSHAAYWIGVRDVKW